jgi:hypothetical protein
MKRTTRHAPRPLGTPVGPALQNLRRTCAGREAVEESLFLGHAAFRVHGTPFAVLDRSRGSGCLRRKLPAAERAALRASPGWFKTPNDPRRSALSKRLAAIDGRRVHPHDRIGRALVAASRARTRRGAGR